MDGSAKFRCRASQDVKRGAPLIRIDNPELSARERESEAAPGVAEAELARVRAGFRAETIAVRKAEVDRATADLARTPPISSCSTARHRGTAVLLVLASSLPQFFLVGVSWPTPPCQPRKPRAT